jgi:hypothetical protein
MANEYKVIMTAGEQVVTKRVAANSRREAARLALDDNAALQHLSEDEPLIVHVTLN